MAMNRLPASLPPLPGAVKAGSGFPVGLIAPKGQGLGQFLANGAHVTTLAAQIIRHGAAQAGIGDEMGRARRHRAIAPGELVLALCPGLDPRQTVGEGVIDGLVIADLEMQEGVILDAAPVAARRARPCR